MHLARHSITATNPVQVIDTRFDADNRIFTVSTPSGFGIYRTWPLKLMQKRDLPDGTLAIILPLHSTSLLFLVGGGRNPLYPPNKVVFWDASLEKEVVELEFKERVRGMACRRGLLAVALKRRVVTFEVSAEKVERTGEWDTCENEKGLIALATAPNSTLLIMPGRQVGHVRLVHLPPCPPPPPPSPPLDVPRQPAKPAPQSTKHSVSVIVAHTTSLTTLSLPPSGRLVSTTSSRGTLIRVWDAITGKLVRELRRGTDRADIYGVAFRHDEAEVCVWSDKGTIHVFKLGEPGEGANNRQSTFSPLSGYIHKYFSSQWSYARYRLPASSTHISLHSAQSSLPADSDTVEEEKCVVGWIEVPVPIAPSPNPSPRPSAIHTPSGQSPKPTSTPPQTRIDYQLIALTYAGGWHRLSIPSSSPSVSIPTSSSPPPGASSVAGAGSLSTSPGRSSPSPASGPRSPSQASRAPSILSSRADKGKERERDSSKEKESHSRECVLEEFRRFGRWDGWG